jgi:hypothetical protein
MIRDLKDLRREAVELTQEFESIMLLTNSIERHALAMLRDDEDSLMIATSKKDLWDCINMRRKDVASWRDDKQVRASRQELIDLLQLIRATPEGKLAYVRIAHLARLIGLYEHYPKPSHCQIGFPKDGIDSRHWAISWRLLEGLLYEDMCALYNPLPGSCERARTPR